VAGWKTREDRSLPEMMRLHRDGLRISLMNTMPDSNQASAPPEATSLYAAATAAAGNAYAPYSGFRVGAALLLSDGRVVAGCNVENSSYGLTICAERSALVRAVSELGSKVRIAGIAVTNLNGAPSPPCGACRQVLSEFVEPDAWIVFPGADGRVLTSFEEVFPFHFHFEQRA
jgi:cytidine deaminase